MSKPTAPDEEFEFVGPNDEGWYRTQIPDWIALCPQVTHTAFRLYVVVRSLILEKQPKKVRLLSDEQLAFLLPGPKGKPSGVRTIKDALQVLTEVGLVSNPDGERIVTSRGRGTISTRRRYQLHDWPTTTAVAATNWRNAFDKLDTFTEDWRESRTDVFPDQDVVQNSAPRTDQGIRDGASTPETTAQDDVSAGQFVMRDSAGTVRDSAGTVRDSARNADTTSNDVSALKQFPQGVSSSSGGTTATPAPQSSVEEEEEESPSAAKHPRGVAPVDLVLEHTDATADEAHALVEEIRPDARKSLGGYLRTLAARGDLDHRLWLLRRQQAPQERAQAPAPRRRGVCALHGIQGPCPACREDLNEGGVLAQAVTDMFEALGPDRALLRPDLAQHPDLAPAAG